MGYNRHGTLQNKNGVWSCERCKRSGTFDELMLPENACPPYIAKNGASVSPDEQLVLWRDGTSVCPNTSGECCPDFSCCRPKLQWDRARREKYLAAGQGEREKMLMSSLGAAIADATTTKVRVTRGVPEDDE